MAGTYKTPDVYVEEISMFPPSVAEVGTAIPAFIGYTETARLKADGDLHLKPTKIYSLNEFETLYGFPHADALELTVTTATDGLKLTGSNLPDPTYLLYLAVRMYFINGGGEAYIVSVGGYANPPAIEMGTGAADGLIDGLDKLAFEDEPTLIVIPEAVKLPANEYADLVKAVLSQCGTLMDRFGVFDIHNGGGPAPLTPAEQTDERARFGTGNLKYGAAYYPFLRTSFNHWVPLDESNVTLIFDGASALLPTYRNTATAAYNFAKAALRDRFITLPPSPAVAGVYAATDAARGVWKSPANVSLAGVVEPVVKLDNARQDGLNVDPTTGASINAIRAFAGKGTLVWGARTLDGNSNEWRYVSVRRFFNKVEESVKKSTYWAVFENNDANTWVKVRGMIENYLIDKWRDGALAGATPKEAFFVKCGLGSTMTFQDILEGRMNVEIGMAAVRPAEFIILKFSHKVQTS